MALSYSIVKQTIIGDERLVVVDVTFDNSYPTGGLAITASAIGLTTIDHVTNGVSNVSTTFYDTFYIPSTGKVAAKSAAAQVSSTTDLSALTVRLKVIGK